jgi:hypothetical protein
MHRDRIAIDLVSARDQLSPVYGFLENSRLSMHPHLTTGLNQEVALLVQIPAFSILQPKTKLARICSRGHDQIVFEQTICGSVAKINSRVDVSIKHGLHVCNIAYPVVLISYQVMALSFEWLRFLGQPVRCCREEAQARSPGSGPCRRESDPVGIQEEERALSPKAIFKLLGKLPTVFLNHPRKGVKMEGLAE